MNLEEYKGVFVFAQQVDNVVSGIAFELIGKGKDLAKDLGTEVTAVLVGSDVTVSYTHLLRSEPEEPAILPSGIMTARSIVQGSPSITKGPSCPAKEDG